MKPAHLIVVLVIVLAVAAGCWLALRPSGVTGASKPNATGAAASPAPAESTPGTPATPAVANAAVTANQPQQSLPMDALAKRLEETLAKAEADRLAGKPLAPHAQTPANPAVRNQPQFPAPRKRPAPSAEDRPVDPEPVAPAAVTPAVPTTP